MKQITRKKRFFTVPEESHTSEKMNPDSSVVKFDFFLHVNRSVSVIGEGDPPPPPVRMNAPRDAFIMETKNYIYA